MRRPAIILAALALGGGAALGAGACGSDDSGSGDTSSNPTASAPDAKPPPTDATTPGTGAEGATTQTSTSETGGTPAGTSTDDGGSTAPVASADFSIGGTKMTPVSVTVPPYVPIDLGLKSTDGQKHTISLSVEGGAPYRVGSEADGAPATTRVEGLKPGVYPVRGDGGQQSNLVVGGEPGP
jgi:hypothetical protein